MDINYFYVDNFAKRLLCKSKQIKNFLNGLGAALFLNMIIE